jgi:uncharacterized protein
MRLDLGKIRTPNERFERVYLPGAFAAGESGADDVRVASPVSLAFEVFKDKDTFRLVGRTRTTLALTCSRCLEPMTVPVDTSFDLRYQPHSAAAGAKSEQEIEEDELTTAFYENDEIDLEQLMREQFLLALPMKPLCSQACHGLCAICGTNLNRGTCNCKPEWEDPRLAALKQLQITSRTTNEAPRTKD